MFQISQYGEGSIPPWGSHYSTTLKTKHKMECTKLKMFSTTWQYHMTIFWCHHLYLYLIYAFYGWVFKANLGDCHCHTDTALSLVSSSLRDKAKVVLDRAGRVTSIHGRYSVNNKKCLPFVLAIVIMTHSSFVGELPHKTQVDIGYMSLHRVGLNFNSVVVKLYQLTAYTASLFIYKWRVNGRKL